MTNRRLSLAYFLGKDQDRIFLGLASGILFVRILLKILSASPKVAWSSFLDPALAGNLFVVLFVYVGLLIIAYSWSKILAIPASFIFLILPFFLYFLLLVNNLSFHWDSQAVLLGALGFLISGFWFWGRDPTGKNTRGVNDQRGGWIYLLISVFVIHGILLFLGQNFRTSRVPMADENTFWFSAAQKMLDSGFLAAHQIGYAGGGLHPLGVPFLALS